MNIKLIALDMDGTVLKSDKTISDKTIQVLKTAAKRDILIVPATGRMIKMVPKKIMDMGCIRYALTSNGASVIDLKQNTVIYSNVMTIEETNFIMDFLSKYDVLAETYSGGNSYADKKFIERIPKFKDYPQLYKDMIMQSQIFVENITEFIKSNNMRIEKINIPYMEPQVYKELWEKLNKMKEFTITSSFCENIEINRHSANKGDGLSHLCKHLKIDSKEVMACGDELNDLEMLKFAGCAVAMGNAIEPLKEVADFVTRINDEDGVAFAVEKLAD